MHLTDEALASAVKEEAGRAYYVERNAWVGSGRTLEEFEAAWPSLRLAHMTRAAIRLMEEAFSQANAAARTLFELQVVAANNADQTFAKAQELCALASAAVQGVQGHE